MNKNLNLCVKVLKFTRRYKQEILKPKVQCNKIVNRTNVKLINFASRMKKPIVSSTTLGGFDLQDNYEQSSKRDEKDVIRQMIIEETFNEINKLNQKFRKSKR